MRFSEFYKYSWFANLAYVLWNEENTTDSQKMIIAANDAERIPGDPLSVIPTLGQEIFLTQGWTVSSFQENDPTGFAANVFENGNEKVLAIRGTEGGGLIPIGEQTVGMVIGDRPRFFGITNMKRYNDRILMKQGGLHCRAVPA